MAQKYLDYEGLGYYNSKIEDLLNQVREIAAGRCKVFVLDTSISLNPSNWEECVYYNAVENRFVSFDSQEHFSEWIGVFSGGCANSEFSSQSETLSYPLTPYNYKYIVYTKVSDYHGQKRYIIETFDNQIARKAGDDLYIVQPDIPDRWWTGNVWRFLETGNVVKLEGSQTINGTKTFTSGIKVKGNGVQVVNDGATTTYQLDNDGLTNNFGYLHLYKGTVGIDIGETTTERFLRPTIPNYTDLGSSSNKWKDLYLSGNISDGTNSATVEDLITIHRYFHHN